MICDMVKYDGQDQGSSRVVTVVLRIPLWMQGDENEERIWAHGPRPGIREPFKHNGDRRNKRL